MVPWVGRGGEGTKGSPTRIVEIQEPPLVGQGPSVKTPAPLRVKAPVLPRSRSLDHWSRRARGSSAIPVEFPKPTTPPPATQATISYPACGCLGCTGVLLTSGPLIRDLISATAFNGIHNSMEKRVSPEIPRGTPPPGYLARVHRGGTPGYKPRCPRSLSTPRGVLRGNPTRCGRSGWARGGGMARMGGRQGGHRSET
jgi:hypothetical protein